MKFRKPKYEGCNSEYDEMLCWRWFVFEVCYELRIVLRVPMKLHLSLKQKISQIFKKL
jgi:hypothetical protein